MTIDPVMQTVIATLFAAASGAIGWLIGKLWTDRSELQGKVFSMLEKQYADTDRQKNLFDTMGKTVDGLAQTIKDLAREVQSIREDLQRRGP